MKILDTLKKGRSSDKVRSDIGALTAQRAEAEKKLAELESARRSVLLQDDDTKAEAHDADMARQRRAIERANLKLIPLEEELTASAAFEDQERRLAKYTAAAKLADETAIFLSKEHRKIRERILDLIETLAKAELVVAEANADLPDGKAAILSIEESVRGRPNLSEEVLSEEDFEAWGVRGSGRPLPEKFQDQVSSDPYNPGKFAYTDEYGVSVPCERRRFSRRKFRPALFGRYPAPLFGSYRWPDLVEGDVRNQVYAGAWASPDHAQVLARVKFERERPSMSDTELVRDVVEEIRQL
ncbi:hypothetical protein FZC33_16000 [Labrys sp. KNU-23]|uniref:hypothetical protein n=1 Tax=Labrys sp. KNU-23 TaxID=2789216 RepID=UPI0011EBD365|nr:hypothetical protein [Labrys sp. KNU-23]QEN87726.1 hypothetical protein FZC33_16000 [Labrys sp. KNU-23]